MSWKLKQASLHKCWARLRAPIGASLIEVMIVVVLIGITTLAAARITTYMIQTNNGLVFRLQRVEVKRNLRQLYFSSENCRCLFLSNPAVNLSLSPFPDTALPNSIALQTYTNPLACAGPLQTILTNKPATQTRVPMGSEYILKDVIDLGPNKKIATFEYKIESQKEVLGPPGYIDNILITINHTAGAVSSCGLVPSDDVTPTPYATIPLINTQPAYAAVPNVNTGVIPESNASGVYLALLNFDNGSDPVIRFYGPTPDPTTRTQIDFYQVRATASGVDVRDKSTVILLPVFNGRFFYGINSGGIARIRPFARMDLPYPELRPMVQFNTLSTAPQPRVPDTKYSDAIVAVAATPTTINIPVTISRPNTLEPAGITVSFEVVPTSGGLTTNAVVGTDFDLPAPVVFPLNGITEMNVPLNLNVNAGNNTVKTLILRLNPGTAATVNYPNEYLIRFQN